MLQKIAIFGVVDKTNGVAVEFDDALKATALSAKGLKMQYFIESTAT